MASMRPLGAGQPRPYHNALMEIMLSSVGASNIRARQSTHDACDDIGCRAFTREVIMSDEKRILVTGATGKAGRLLIDRVLSDSRFDGYSVRALCHNRR